VTLFPISGGFDVGIDARTAVDDSYPVPFRFNGTINKVTCKLGPQQLTVQDKAAAAQILAAARD
jgi:hypothetical protein